MEQPYRPPTPEEAVGQYGDLVYRLAYAKTGSRSDADDIYQEVFLRYLRKKPQLESEEHAKAWFLRVTINCMKSFWGSSFRRRSVPLDESLPTEDHPSDGTMESYLRRLPEQYRDQIKMRMVRFRTLGCWPLTGAVESNADTIEKIVEEMMTTTKSERTTRVIDFDQDASMEQKKREGYF